MTPKVQYAYAAVRKANGEIMYLTVRKTRADAADAAVALPRELYRIERIKLRSQHE